MILPISPPPSVKVALGSHRRWWKERFLSPTPPYAGGPLSPTRWWRWFTKCHTHVRGKSSHDQRSLSQPSMHLHRGRVTANPSSPRLHPPKKASQQSKGTRQQRSPPHTCSPETVARQPHPLSTSNSTRPPHSSPSILLSKPRLNSTLGSARVSVSLPQPRIPSNFPGPLRNTRRAACPVAVGRPARRTFTLLHG